MRLIIACDPNGGIGVNNMLPWLSLQDDLARFKRLTTNQVVIMGKNTWYSLPIKPLPNRINIVITQEPIPDVITSNSLAICHNYPDAWIIGGARLVESSWNLIDEVHLSRTFTEYDCDTYIDLLQLTHFSKVHTEPCADHDYEIWKRK